MNHLSRSFEPVIDINSKALILGTMPGRESLERKEYYANNRNNFWRILYTVMDMNIDSSYQRKIAFLNQNRIALWDVLMECVRKGSLDSAIEDEVPNNFNEFFERYPNVRFVFFNGAKAAKAFERNVELDRKYLVKLNFQTLPSTSPANAAQSFEYKLIEWRSVRDCLNDSR